MRFDDRVTGKLATFAPNARKIHVEIDPAEINKNVTVDVGLIGDVREVLEALLPRRRARTTTRRGSRASGRSGSTPRRAASRASPTTAASTPRTPSTTSGRRPAATRVVVTDVGQHQMWEAQYYRHEAPRSLITSGGLGPMGFALPAAIGAKLARPDADVWVVVGDGGFQMTMAELGTLMQERVKINIAIINNGYLGMVRQLQEFFYGARYHATPLVEPGLRHARQRLRHSRHPRRRIAPASSRPSTPRGARRAGRCSTSASNRTTRSIRWSPPARASIR